jgi:hypothetical protein
MEESGPRSQHSPAPSGRSKPARYTPPPRNWPRPASPGTPSRTACTRTRAAQPARSSASATASTDIAGRAVLRRVAELHHRLLHRLTPALKASRSRCRTGAAVSGSRRLRGWRRARPAGRRFRESFRSVPSARHRSQRQLGLRGRESGSGCPRHPWKPTRMELAGLEPVAATIGVLSVFEIQSVVLGLVL